MEALLCSESTGRKNWIPPYQVRGKFIKSGMTLYVKVLLPKDEQIERCLENPTLRLMVFYRDF